MDTAASTTDVRLRLDPTQSGRVWEDSPRRITVAGHTVRPGWHGPSDVNEISVSGAGRDRLDLLVVPPGTSEATAEAAMATAARGDNFLHGTRILDADGVGGTESRPS